MGFKNTAQAIAELGGHEFRQIFKKKYPKYKQTRDSISKGLKIKDHQIDEVMAHVEEGLSNEKIGKHLGCSEMTVIRFRNKHDLYLRR